MNIICDKQALIDAVGNVQRAVSGKSTLPALEGILLRAAGSSLFLAGFDLDLGITTTIDADVRQPGEIVLTAKLFGEIVRKLPGDRVTLTSDERFNTTIQSDVTEFTIMGISASEYPEIPSVDDGASFTLPQNTLKSMIRQTIFAPADTHRHQVRNRTRQPPAGFGGWLPSGHALRRNQNPGDRQLRGARQNPAGNTQAAGR